MLIWHHHKMCRITPLFFHTHRRLFIVLGSAAVMTSRPARPPQIINETPTQTILANTVHSRVAEKLNANNVYVDNGMHEGGW